MCYSPLKVKDTTGVSAYNYIHVPCGKCFECREKRSAQWSYRLSCEDRVHATSFVTTLTYEDNNLVYTDDGPTLVKHDLQCFFKRLRKRTATKVKYYACGEYGSDSHRPHYHAVIFGATEDGVLDSWNCGHVHFMPFGPATARYVTNYLCKSAGLDFGLRQPEFSVMSKGLGKSYLTPEMISWHEQNRANYCVNPGGVRQAMPRYYKDRIFDQNERQKFGIEHSNRLEAEFAKFEAENGYYELERRRMEATKQKINSADKKSKNRNKL